MNSLDAAAILDLTTDVRVRTVHDVYRQLLATLDPAGAEYRRELVRLKAARDVLASRASNAFKDSHRRKTGIVHFPPGRHVRPEPPRTLTPIPWPQCRFVPSRFFDAAGQVVRVMDLNNLAVINGTSREVIGTLARHPRRPQYFCFRRLDRSFGEIRGVRFFTMTAAGVEPATNGGV